MPRTTTLTLNPEHSYIGAIIRYISSDGIPTYSALMLDQTSYDEGYSGNYPYGIFPKLMIPLLISIKNKCCYTNAEGNKVYLDPSLSEVTDISLQGLIYIKKSSTEEYELANALSYSTLPFTYICDNDLGHHGRGMPIYNAYTSSILTGTDAIHLDRKNGGFYFKKLDNEMTVTSTVQLNTDTFRGFVKAYNQDFVKSNRAGATSDLLLSFNISVAHPVAHSHKSAIYSRLLTQVADRWFATIAPGTTPKDYNIGASLYYKIESPRGNIAYVTMLTSLNTKSINRAAHAEVQAALFCDFILAAKLYAPNAYDYDFLASIGLPHDLLLEATSTLRPASESNSSYSLGLFSTLLPCYMCLGSIESTVSGRIATLNGQRVDLFASFDYIDTSLFITDTDYYDVDGALQYRHIYMSELFSPLKATVTQINVSQFLPVNAKIVSTVNDQITPDPRTVSDAGSTVFGIGLQNNENMLRYKLVSEVMDLLPSKEGALRINFDL